MASAKSIESYVLRRPFGRRDVCRRAPREVRLYFSQFFVPVVVDPAAGPLPSVGR